MKDPDFSRHTIADIRDWKKHGKLEIQPSFQRSSVWNPAAKIMLIDSILRRIPIPKIFIGSKIQDGSTHRIIIDGQQRITAILEFLANKFCLSAPYVGPYKDLFFKDLDSAVQNEILGYNLDFNSFEDYSDEEIRDIYQRVNKYTFALTKQELRRADFPGDFLNLSEELSSLDFFEDGKIFTVANRRRLGDVEYVSELLSILFGGIQNKKESLDGFYIKNSNLTEIKKELYKGRFLKIIYDLERVFPPNVLPIGKTRFRQKSDFYSLFSAINELHMDGYALLENSLAFLRKDICFLDSFIAPSAPALLGDYALRCVSDANSYSSREWRRHFIKNFLHGAYNSPDRVSKERIDFLGKFIGIWDTSFSQEAVEICPICHLDIGEHDKHGVWVFPETQPFLHLAILGHKLCMGGIQTEYAYYDEN